MNHNSTIPLGQSVASFRQEGDALSAECLRADLKGRSVRGGLLSVIAQVTQVLVQSISTILLARLLTPTDFGLVAMVNAVTVIAWGFADLGLTEATIQRKELTHNQVSTLFWINVAMGLFLTFVTAGMAPFLAKFYEEPRLVGITLVASVSFLIAGLRGQHNALLKRQMLFKSLAIRDVTSSLLGVIVAVGLALRGAGYWAILASPLTANLSQMVMSWLMIRWRPGLPHFGPEIRTMVGFGGNVAVSYVIFNWVRNADNILIGRYWGAGPLGLYSRAFNLLTLGISQITAPTCSVAIPALSRIQDEAELFARYYLKIMNLIVWIIASLFGFLFVAATPVIVLVLGAKWREAAPVFQILTISALGQVLLESTLWVLISRGQSARLLKLMLFLSPIMLGSFVIGLPFGIKGVALSLSITLLCTLPWILRFTFRNTNLTLTRLFEALVRPVALSLSGVLLGKLALRLFAPQSEISQLFVAALSFLVTYSLSMLIPSVRKEFESIRKVLAELRSFRKAV
jgi:PST family polysaccharide transporter